MNKHIALGSTNLPGRGSDAVPSFMPCKTWFFSFSMQSTPSPSFVPFHYPPLPQQPPQPHLTASISFHFFSSTLHQHPPSLLAFHPPLLSPDPPPRPCPPRPSLLASPPPRAARDKNNSTGSRQRGPARLRLLINTEPAPDPSTKHAIWFPSQSPSSPTPFRPSFALSL